MPIYLYKCETCEMELEQLQKHDDPPPVCECSSLEMVKQMGLSSFRLKGSGWYATDYKGTKKE